MVSRCLPAVLLAALILPARAHADPVTITLHSVQGGASASVPSALSFGVPTPLGEIRLPTAGAAVALAVGGLPTQGNYLMELIVHGASSSWNTLRAEILDPLGDGDDGFDVAPFHAGVPDGFSPSNDNDGLSFAQGAGLERSAAFAGGLGSVMANERSNAADALVFAGLAAAGGPIRITFGLRDLNPGGGFLLRFSSDDAARVFLPDDPVATPEPASMLLIGTGLAGLAATRRYRSRR